MKPETIDIVFDGPPGPESGRFVEVERPPASIRIGEWVHREDGYWALRIPDPEATPVAVATLTAALKSDPGYRIAWVANIAMAFKDEYARRVPEASDELRQIIHEIANAAAGSFLDNLLRESDK